MSRLLFLPCVALASAVVAQPFDSSNFNALARRFQPPPADRDIGGDNGAGDGRHNAGEDCGICHAPGGKAGALVFTIAGTVYEDRAARRPTRDAEVILQGYDGKVLSMTTNAVGNFWTLAPLGSNPWAVSAHGSTTDILYQADAGVLVRPADPADSRTWEYKAWVRRGDDVRHMVTLAPVGGASASTVRMSCNMHHAPLGSSGALWASSRPTLASYPQQGLSFRRHVLPVLMNKCVPCHLPGPRRTRAATATDLDPHSPTTADYSGGKDYTSYAGSSVSGTTKGGFRSVVDPTQPDQSPALLKTLKRDDGSVTHAGGAFFRPSDADYQAIRQWIVEGARDD